MPFFDFLGAQDPYSEAPGAVTRLNARHAAILSPLAGEARGARVYDIAAHDGRWAYAWAGLGAREVEAVEARGELIARFDGFPDPAVRARVRLAEGDLHDHTRMLARSGARFDIVSVHGIFYHVMDHFGLLRDIALLQPRLVVVDGEFMLRDAPMIMLTRERTDNPLNAAPQLPGQKMAVKGVPSRLAMETMADVLGYGCEWLDWEAAVPVGQRSQIRDYYRKGRMRRATCFLRPRSGPGRERAAT